MRSARRHGDRAPGHEKLLDEVDDAVVQDQLDPDLQWRSQNPATAAAR